MRTPLLSVIILTWNEEQNIGPCLRALAVQSEQAFEVIVLDAASTDKTVPIIRSMMPSFPARLELHVAARKTAIGESRNMGVNMARCNHIAFLSADAEPGPDWVREAVRSLDGHDMVFGPQTHAPHKWTVGASVRGLRYHFPDTEVSDPLPYASNVAAAYTREVLGRFPFDPWANAAEDLLLAKRAVAAGFKATYNPRMVVRHHDVATSRVEMRKNVREGRGCALYRRELGLLGAWLTWAGALGGALTLAALAPGWPSFALLAVAIWAPAIRRGTLRYEHMPRRALVRAIAATPLFDLAFLVNYLAALTAKAPAPPRPYRSKETKP